MAFTINGGVPIIIECNRSFSNGFKLNITGNVKEIMKESILTSIAWIKSNIHLINKNFSFENNEIHIHVPDASIPKDGPSAGIAICSSLVSLIVNTPLRNDTALTGEISLAGFVLPVGGIKEKILGCYYNGIKRFIISKKNKKDVDEFLNCRKEDESYKEFKDISIVYVTHIKEVLNNIFSFMVFDEEKGLISKVASF